MCIGIVKMVSSIMRKKSDETTDKQQLRFGSTSQFSWRFTWEWQQAPSVAEAACSGISDGTV